MLVLRANQGVSYVRLILHTEVLACLTSPSSCKEPQTSMEKLMLSDTMPIFVCDFPKCGRSYTSEYSFSEHQKLRAHAKSADNSKSTTSSGTSAEKASEGKVAPMSAEKPPPTAAPLAAPSPAPTPAAASTSLEAPAPPARRLLNLAIRSGRPEPSAVDQSRGARTATVAQPSEHNGTRHTHT